MTSIVKMLNLPIPPSTKARPHFVPDNDKLTVWKPAPIPRPPPPTEMELRSWHYYREYRERVRNGPYYTKINDGFKLEDLDKPWATPQPEMAPDAIRDPFTATKTYSANKYEKKYYELPRIHSRPYVPHFFPKELQDLVNPNGINSKNNAGVQKRPRLAIQAVNTQRRLDNLEELLKEAEDDDQVEDDVAEDADHDQQDDEDNLSEMSADSEESADDYNAEQYFDNGDDEYGDDEGNDEPVY